MIKGLEIILFCERSNRVYIFNMKEKIKGVFFKSQSVIMYMGNTNLTVMGPLIVQAKAKI